MASNENTRTLEEVSQIPQLLPFQESVTKILNTEEAVHYTGQIQGYLQSQNNLSVEIHALALTVLNALSHLTDSREILKEQCAALSGEAYRELHYSVPFFSEILSQGSLLQWHQREAKGVTTYSIVKGDYTPIRHTILLYKLTALRFASEPEQRKEYQAILEVLANKILGILKQFSQAYASHTQSHPWLSLEEDHLPEYHTLQSLWKLTVDQITVRHQNKLPKQFQRSPDKFDPEWKELLTIQHPKQVTLLNFFRLLNATSSPSREIRAYSCLLLHLIAQERPALFESAQHARVHEDFVTRLRVGYQLKKTYPDLPSQKIPLRLHSEMFLLLYEQAMNSLAVSHQIHQGADLQEKFYELFEQVETKEKILMESVAPSPPEPPKKSAAPEIKHAPFIEADYEPITDAEELSAGMGVTNMPYVFPFTYEEHQAEIPLELIPNINWNEMEWSANRAGDIQVYTAESKLLVQKLEKVYAYRYSIYPAYDISAIKPFKNYLCFLVRQDQLDQPTEYFIVKKGSKSRFGRNSVWIPLHLSEERLRHLEKAFFFIFPPPYNQHLLAIPRE